jgi:hypothetical protein
MSMFGEMRMTIMRRIVATVLLGGLVLALGAAPASAQSGHFIAGGAGAPSCRDIGTQLTCTGKVAGLGGTTFEIRGTASGIATVECENPGGNVAPGQDTAVAVAGSTGPLPTPRNGQYVFSITTDAPTVANYPTCPNPQWTAHVVDVTFGDATLSLYEDGVQVDQVTVPAS